MWLSVMDLQASKIFNLTKIKFPSFLRFQHFLHILREAVDCLRLNCFNLVFELLAPTCVRSDMTRAL